MNSALRFIAIWLVCLLLFIVLVGTTYAVCAAAIKILGSYGIVFLLSAALALVTAVSCHCR